MVGKRLSHYRIVEQIGAGGMGVVYLAHDEQLDRDVAIKVLPSGSLSDESARRRFRKEAQSLARQNHPNIATIHEFGTENGIDFLVTEYIPGVTLDQKLTAGALPAAETVRLGQQMCAGLEAAHQQGVVHRDLKPGNLRLTPDGRLKILDFGLAQLMPRASDLGVTVTLTQSQETSGTLPYMAPEQLSGESSDARADVWAAGAVLYEMATGKRPFPQSVPALLINAILNQRPEPPSRVHASVPASLEAVILKTLSRDRTQRYQSAAELGAALESLTSSGFPVTPPLPAAKSGKWRIGAVAIIVIALAAGASVLLRRASKNAAKPDMSRRRSVAVLGFKNISANPEKSWISTAIAEMLTTELSQGDQLRTIPGESIAQMKASLALPDADSFSQQTLARIRENLGSDDVIIGSYVELGNGLLRLDLRLQDALAGGTLASISEKGSETEIDDLISRAGAELRAKLGAGALSQAQSALVKASMPANAEAARLYSQGLQRLRLVDAMGARDALERAAKIDPNFALIHSALGDAYLSLGYEGKAEAEAKLALAQSANLPKEDQLLIAGHAHERLKEREQAVESYRTLVQSFPDNLDFGLLLVRAQADAGRADEATKTLSGLRPLATLESERARLDLVEADTALLVSDYKRAQTLAASAAARGHSIGATLLEARALQVEATSFERLGDSPKVSAVINRARELYVAAGDPIHAAACLFPIADVLYYQGNYAEAKKQFEIALAEFRRIGAQSRVRTALERIGNVHYSLGELPEAKKYYEQCEAYDRDTNDPANLASDYGNLANTYDSLGELAEAYKMQQQALAAFNQVGDRRGAAETMNNTGNVLVELGRLEEARKYFEDSLALTRQISFKRTEASPISGMGDVLLFQGKLAECRAKYEQSIATAKQVEDDDYVVEVTMGVGTLDLFEGKNAEGETLAAEAVEHFHKSGNAAYEAWAYSLEARHQLAQGKADAAEKNAAKALELAKKNPGPPFAFEASFADAAVKAHQRRFAEARQELDATLATAHKDGYRVYEFETRWLLAKLEKDSGATTAAAHLAAVEKGARAAGIGLFADQAHAAIASAAAGASH